MCRELQELFPAGVGIHHAGMLRPDRTLMERAFAAGLIKVRAPDEVALTAAGAGVCQIVIRMQTSAAGRWVLSWLQAVAHCYDHVERSPDPP